MSDDQPIAASPTAPQPIADPLRYTVSRLEHYRALRDAAEAQGKWLHPDRIVSSIAAVLAGLFFFWLGYESFSQPVIFGMSILVGLSVGWIASRLYRTELAAVHSLPLLMGKNHGVLVELTDEGLRFAPADEPDHGRVQAWNQLELLDRGWCYLATDEDSVVIIPKRIFKTSNAEFAFADAVREKAPVY